jgi:preprotein translocase subunit SecE
MKIAVRPLYVSGFVARFTGDAAIKVLRTRLMVNPIEFFKEVRQEASKISWPTRKEVWITTLAVMVMVTVASLFFMAADQVFGWLTATVLGINR